MGLRSLKIVIETADGRVRNVVGSRDICQAFAGIAPGVMTTVEPSVVFNPYLV